MFLQNMWIAFSQVAILALLAMVGFFCHKGGLFTDKVAKLCNGLVFYIVTPSVVCHSFLQLDPSADTLKLLLFAMIGGFAFHLFGVILTGFMFNRSPAPAVYKYAAMYGNMGFMGIPLSQALLQSTGVFICSVMIFIFNLFCFTHGASIMNKGVKINLFKILVNPGTIGIALGLPLFLLNVELPKILLQPLTHLSNLNTPLAMIMLGAYLGATKLSSIFKIKENYIVLVIKLIFLPAVTIGVSYLLGIRGNLLVGFALMSCVPTATNTVMFAAQFGQDTGRSSMSIALSNLASIITMPLWIALAQSL
ncbi:MAG: AEC family transporter [Clostridia bacterium]|nr:AEC family transporter [Clostridia bacterium]